MSLLIDGYNVLHLVGVIGRGVGPGSLQRARLALLNFLAASLDEAEIPRTTVVFDAHDSPPGMPRVVEHRGLVVRFASQYDDADSLIEELILRESAPRRLTVVSSDRRIQRAARRRKAKAVDSEVWYAEVVTRRRQRRQSAGQSAARPAVPLLEEDVDYWIRQFGGESLLEELIEEESTTEEAAGLENPFPPGYAEDLLEDEDPHDPYDPFPPGHGDD